MLIRLESLKEKEEIKNLKEVDKYKDQLLASVTHDLRTPLIGINFMLDQAKCAETKEELHKYLN